MSFKEFIQPTLAKVLITLPLVLIPQAFLFNLAIQRFCEQGPCPLLYGNGIRVVSITIIPNIIVAYFIVCLLIFIVNKLR